jgi:hypothetical protein
MDVHFDPEVITVAGPGYLDLAVPVADRVEEKIYFGFGAGKDRNLTRGVCIARRRLGELPVIVENGNVYAERFMTKVDRAADEVVAVQTRREESGAVFGHGDRSAGSHQSRSGEQRANVFHCFSSQPMVKYPLLPFADRYQSYRQTEHAIKRGRRLSRHVDLSFTRACCFVVKRPTGQLHRVDGGGRDCQVYLTRGAGAILGAPRAGQQIALLL